MSTKEEQLSYWTEKSELWKSGGLTQKEFCEQQALDYGQFIFWRSQMRNQVRNQKRRQDKPQSKPVGPKVIKVNTGLESKLNLNKEIEASSGLEVILPMDIKLYLKTRSDVEKASQLLRLLGGNP